MHSSFCFKLDVIRCLHEVIRTQKLENGKKACANIALNDAVGNIIDCTLWDTYACQLLNFVRPDNAVGSNTLIITHALCKQTHFLIILFIHSYICLPHKLLFIQY